MHSTSTEPYSPQRRRILSWSLNCGIICRYLSASSQNFYVALTFITHFLRRSMIIYLSGLSLYQCSTVDEINRNTRLQYNRVLGERYYVTFALWHEPVIYRLSVVCNVVALYTRGLNFSTLCLNHLLRTWAVCVKILDKIPRGSTWSCKLNRRGMIDWRFSINISPYFENYTRYDHNYNGRIYKRTVEFYHFQWSWVTFNLDFKVTILANVK